MTNTTTALTVLLALVFTALGLAKILAAPGMRAKAAHVGFSTSAYRRIGALEVLGAAGLLVGLVEPVVGILAGAGLTLLLLGALGVHVRNGDGPRTAAPAALFGAVTVAYIATQAGAL